MIILILIHSLSSWDLPRWSKIDKKIVIMTLSAIKANLWCFSKYLSRSTVILILSKIVNETTFIVKKYDTWSFSTNFRKLTRQEFIEELIFSTSCFTSKPPFSNFGFRGITWAFQKIFSNGKLPARALWKSANIRPDPSKLILQPSLSLEGAKISFHRLQRKFILTLLLRKWIAGSFTGAVKFKK